MNGLEKITGKIAEDSRAASEELLAGARERAAEITARYDAEAEALEAELKEKAETAAKERVERILGAAEMDAKKALLTTKQELIGEAFNRAKDKLTQMPGDKKAELLAKLAASSARTGKEQICLSEKDSRLSDKVLSLANGKLKELGIPAGLTLSLQNGSFDGGVILKDGDITVNCTFDALLHNLRDKMSGEVAKSLFN